MLAVVAVFKLEVTVVVTVAVVVALVVAVDSKF